MKRTFVEIAGMCLVAAILSGTAHLGYCANLNVPAQYGHITDAIAAAQPGDEIRVSSDFRESDTFVEVSGKTVTIKSYDPGYTFPQIGAQWDSYTSSGVDTSLLEITNGSVTIQGFGLLHGIDCNVFMLDSDSNLTIKDCVLSGTGVANTAGIKTSALAENINVNIDNTTFTQNGRGIWFNSVYGDTSLTITNSSFLHNSSYPIEWRTNRGDHHFTMTDSHFTLYNNRAVRLLAFNTINGDLGKNHIEFDRCDFRNLPTGRYPIAVGGMEDAADPESTFTLGVKNCLFDLKDGDDNVETVAINSQDDTATRRSEINVDQTTIVFGGTQQCGFRLRENQSTMTVANSIVDGNGGGLVALRGWRGKIISRVNLLFAAGVSQSASGGSVDLSGNEVVGQATNFADLTNHDFQLAQGSPALGIGEDLGISEDILKNPRPNPVGSNPDLGAYEKGANASVADWALF